MLRLTHVWQLRLWPKRRIFDVPKVKCIRSKLSRFNASELLGMDEWVWQYQEIYPDQLRVVKRLRKTEEIYSPPVAVKDWEWTDCDKFWHVPANTVAMFAGKRCDVCWQALLERIMNHYLSWTYYRTAKSNSMYSNEFLLKCANE